MISASATITSEAPSSTSMAAFWSVSSPRTTRSVGTSTRIAPPRSFSEPSMSSWRHSPGSVPIGATATVSPGPKDTSAFVERLAGPSPMCSLKRSLVVEVCFVGSGGATTGTTWMSWGRRVTPLAMSVSSASFESAKAPASRIVWPSAVEPAPIVTCSARLSKVPMTKGSERPVVGASCQTATVLGTPSAVSALIRTVSESLVANTANSERSRSARATMSACVSWLTERATCVMFPTVASVTVTKARVAAVTGPPVSRSLISARSMTPPMFTVSKSGIRPPCASFPTKRLVSSTIRSTMSRPPAAAARAAALRATVSFEADAASRVEATVTPRRVAAATATSARMKATPRWARRCRCLIAKAPRGMAVKARSRPRSRRS